MDIVHSSDCNFVPCFFHNSYTVWFSTSFKKFGGSKLILLASDILVYNYIESVINRTTADITNTTTEKSKAIYPLEC